MTLNTIKPNSFVRVLSALNDPETIYLIPSFQRPYSWGQNQVKDLFRDMEKAASVKNGFHYLSAIHLIPIDPENPQTELMNPLEGVASCIHSIFDENGEVCKTDKGNPINLFAVIDGQQRLTTLFLLANLFYSLKGSSPKSSLEVALSCGVTLPRLIQNPEKDHVFMMQLVDQIWKNPKDTSPMIPMKATSQSQRNLVENFLEILKWGNGDSVSLNFISSNELKTTIIELDINYGLTSFMTLNDRGKALSVLEKLKALLLQYAVDSNAVVPTATVKPLIRKIHDVFGEVYDVLSSCQFSGLFSRKHGDDEIVRLISCYLGLNKNSAAITQGADSSYNDFFRDGLIQAVLSDVPSLVKDWCVGISEMKDELKELNEYLLKRKGALPSIHFPSTSKLFDDYRATILSLGLQPHLLALLLKFRAKFGRDWHEKFPISHGAFSFDPIRNFIDDIKSKVGAGAPKELWNYLDDLRKENIEPKSEISMLEIVERMQLFDWNLWSRRIKGFVRFCESSFEYTKRQDFLTTWFSWRSHDDFIGNILNGYNDVNFRFLLKEFERSSGQNLHFELPKFITTDIVELEHVFAEHFDKDPSFPGFKSFGLTDRQDFEDSVLWRSGNLLWLSKKGNDSAGNQRPDIKAADYKSCTGHPRSSGDNVCSKIFIVSKLGKELSALGPNYKALRFHIEGRCAELARFAVTRFC